MSGHPTEPEELTEEQLAELAEAMRTLREELTDLLAETEEGAKPVQLDQQSVGRLTRMDAIQQQKMAEANRRSHRRRLTQLASALSALESGDYGYCRRCEEPIGYPRLKARPESPFCLRCQGQAERG